MISPYGIFIAPHLGLGDGIILNGMVRVLAQSNSVTFPSKPHNFPSVAWMFSDLRNVAVVKVENDEDMLASADKWTVGKVIKLGMYGPNWMPGGDPAHFDEQMYRDAGVNFECSWSHFKVPEVKNDLNPVVDQFVCDDPGRGYRIDTIKVPCGRISRPHITEPIFWWKPYIMKARQIHCIDSSFRNWIDRMPNVQGQRLFWHKYARHYQDGRFDPSYRRNWEIIA